MSRAPDSLDWGPLSDSLGILLRLPQFKAHDAYFAAKESVTALSGSASIHMMVRQKPGLRQGVLARAFCIKRAHMTKNVQALEQPGHLSGTVPPDDRRSIKSCLTSKRQSEAQCAWSAASAHEAETPASLSTAEGATLRTLLRKYLSLQEHGHGHEP